MGFSREGAKVVIADINIEAANKTAEEVLKNGGEALAIKTDVSSVEDTQEMVRKTIDRFGKIDILVNNAAIFGRVRMKIGPFDELEMSVWDRSWDVNVKGPFLCCRAVFPKRGKDH
jgi:3-oxoacyl-[acyl-carrier protein] reductase